MQKIKVAIFDMDGTLVDSLPIVLFSLCEAYRRLTGKRVPKEKFKHLLGEPLSLISNRTFPENPGAFSREFKKIISGQNPKLRFFPGTKRALARLSRRGTKLVIVSGIDRKSIIQILRANRADKTFRGRIFCAGDFEGGKASGAPFMAACRKLGAAPDEAIALGDTALDCRGAARAGCLAIGVKSALHSGRELKSAGAALVINSVSELERLFSEGRLY